MFLKVADQAVISKEKEEEKTPGLHCINYLFTFGADCLKKWVLKNVRLYLEVDLK